MKKQWFYYFLLIISSTGLGIFINRRCLMPNTTAVPSHVMFNDKAFDFEFIRTLGCTAYQTADVGECFATAQRIKDGDFESWYEEWYATAERINAIAQQCEVNSHHESARLSYLRASNYYRTSEFYLHGNKNDPRIKNVTHKSRDCFLHVINLSKPTIEIVKIPYENRLLPGYFYHGTGSAKLKPTIIIQTGFDGTQEELYVYAADAIKRGYNVLTFEGPGQGEVIHEQGLPFRADWEYVIRPVVDYVFTRADVDTSKLALYGLSLGGYLAPRGAAHDARIKALIANAGVYDPVEGMMHNFKKFASSKEELIAFIKQNPKKFNLIMYAVMRTSSYVRWAMEHGMYSFTCETPGDFILKYADLSMKDHAAKITCPTLICDSEHELGGLVGQAQMLYDHLTCEKTFIAFKADEGAGFHCQMGALLRSNQCIFDWLDEVFARAH